MICGAGDDVPEGIHAHIPQWGEGQEKDLSGDLADALGPNMTHLSAGSGRNSKKLTWLGLPHHRSPLAISYATCNAPKLSETQERGLHPSLEGRGQVAAAGENLGPVEIWIGQDWVVQAVLKPQLGPTWAFTKGSTMQMMVGGKEQEWLMWLMSL